MSQGNHWIMQVNQLHEQKNRNSSIPTGHALLLVMWLKLYPPKFELHRSEDGEYHEGNKSEHAGRIG